MIVFDPFRLDTANHCLWHAEQRVSLTPKAFDILRYLVERTDRLVTRDEILEALWPDTYVNPEGIRKYILEIRRALGDSPDQPRFITTLPKRGYQFVAALSEEPAVAPRGLAGGSTAVTPRAIFQQVTPHRNAPIGTFVGREAALSQLVHYLEKGLSGQRQVVFVTGEAGIGKTTLVDLFQQYTARYPNLRIARGQCIEGFGGTEAYYPMLEAVGSLAQAEDGPAWVETLAQRAPTWLVQFPSLVKVGQREPLQREILGSTRGRMVREICEAFEGVTAQIPLIVILEDLHWVDPSTLDLISAFARRREPARLLLIGTYRPVEAVLSQSPLKALKQDLLVRHLCHEVSIERLDESEVAEYLSKEFVNHTFPAGLANLIHHNSGGNPLFMAAIVREIVKRGVITHHRAAWTLTAPLAEVYPGIPETLQQMLEIQFEQLSSEEQRVLESCSVAGERFSAWAASIMLGTLPPSIEEICDRLAQRQQFIRFVGIQEAANGAESAHYEFRHSLYRQALYRRLSSPNRSKLHRSLAEGLLPACTAGKQELASELALHFEEGRDYERATHYWMLTAENATARFSHRDAISILRHALEIVPATQGAGMELEIQIRQRVGDLHFALGEISHAAASYQSAAERAGSAGFKTAHVGALVRLAIPAWYLDSARGNEVSQEALEASKSLADPLLAARTQLAAASLRLLYDSWRAEDEETCAQARETIRRLTGSSLVQDVFAICVQTVQGDYQEALRHVEELIVTAANPIAYILGLTAKALNLLPCGRFGEVLRIVRTGREMAEKNGEDPWIHIYCEAWLRIICFDHDGVGRLSQLIMRSNADQHATRARTIALVSSGQAETLRGNYVEALRCFAAVRDFQITPKFFLHWHWRMRAELGTVEAMLGAGDAASARREADGFLRSALSTADPNMRALAWEVKARVAQAQHDVPNARQYIEEALALADRFDIPVVAWQIHSTASDLARQENDGTRVEAHRLRAQELIMRLADSFAPDEPLRRCLLAAPPVQRVLGQATSA